MARTNPDYIGNPTPRDVYLNLDEKIEAVSGSVGEVLPKVTSSDNGKVLKVSSGKWAKQEETKELPTLPTEDGTYTLQYVVASGTGTMSWVAGE